MLPKALYECLPYGCQALGVSSALWSSNTIGVVSALLLMLAAIVILYLRLHARTQQVEEYKKLLAREKQLSGGIHLGHS